jgi:hypothetical protein
MANQKSGSIHSGIRRTAVDTIEAKAANTLMCPT